MRSSIDFLDFDENPGSGVPSRFWEFSLQSLAESSMIKNNVNTEKEVREMKKSSKLLNLSVALFGCAALLFFLFCLYVNHSERIDVFHSRESRSYTAVDTYTREQIRDEAAPVGVRNVYRWTQQLRSKNDTCLTILTVHQALAVYFDDVLVYSMEPSPENRIAGSSGTCWNTIPLYPSDDGVEVTVVVSPLFDSVKDYGAELWCGSQYSILFGQLSKELPQLLISVLCMVLGAFIILVQLYFFVTANTRSWDMVFLGSFAILLGLWRLTYAYSIPILFPQAAMALGYGNIGALFLISVPMGMFACAFVRDQRLLLTASCAGSIVCMLVLLLQVLGVLELREMLDVSHIMLVCMIGVILVAMWRQRKASRQRPETHHPFFLIGIGIVLDLISFNLNETASDVMFTLLFFILYALIVFISYATRLSRSAYTDSRTGLGNRLRWNELMREDIHIPEPFAIMLLDLNGLKRVNDTLGHEAGDRMIFHFANLLRNTFPGSGVICRWGGDEFSVLLTGVSRSQLEEHIRRLLHATEEYNGKNPNLPIYFAVGAALSDEHPKLSRSELFHRADEEMYRNKQLWYTQKRAVK